MKVRREGGAIGASTIAILALIGACRPSSPTFAEGYLCPEPERRCPDDQICVSGVCQRPAEVDAGSLDGGGEPAPVCGSSSQFGADFEVMPFWLGFFTNPEGAGGVAGSVDQALQIDVPANVNAFVAANSRFALDLRDDRFSVEIPSVTGDLEVGLSLIADELGGVTMFQDRAGVLTARLISGDGSALSTVIAAIAPDKVWFSFAESDGEVHFQVSSDNMTWETIRSIPTPTWIALGSPRFEAFSRTGTGGSARFDNVNERDALTDGCAIGNLPEPFDDAELTTGIVVFEEVCSAQVESGELAIDYQAGGEGICGVFSIYLLSLRESETSIEIVQAAAAPTEFTAGLEFESEDGYLAIAVGETTLRAQLCPRLGSCTTLGSLPFDPDAHRFWKIRETGGTSFFELSSDAINWNEFATIATPWPVTAGRPNLFTVNSSEAVNSFRLDNFNSNQ